MLSASGKRTLARVGIVALILVVLYTVWPTPWRYEHACGHLVRLSRLTGRADLLLDGGWQALQPHNPVDDYLERAQSSERLGFLIASLSVCPPAIPAPSSSS